MPVTIGAVSTQTGTLVAGVGNTLDLNFGNVPACDVLVIVYHQRDTSPSIFDSFNGDNAGSTFNGAVGCPGILAGDGATFAYIGAPISQNSFPGANPYIISFLDSVGNPSNYAVVVDIFAINGIAPITVDDQQANLANGNSPITINVSSVDAQELLVSACYLGGNTSPNPTLGDVFETLIATTCPNIGVAFALVAAGVHVPSWDSTQSPIDFGIGAVTYKLPVSPGGGPKLLASLGVG